MISRPLYPWPLGPVLPAPLRVVMATCLIHPQWLELYTEVRTEGYDLMLAIDISRSMNVTDVQPTRLAKARQEVEDLLNLNRGIRVGLIGFATVAHVVSPVTEDINGIQRDLCQRRTRRGQVGCSLQPRQHPL